MNALKLVGVGIGLATLSKIVSAGKGNITAVDIDVSTTQCNVAPCTVTGTVTWRNTGTKAESFTPKIVSGSGTVLYSEQSITLQSLDEHTLSFSISLTEDTAICPDPN